MASFTVPPSTEGMPEYGDRSFHVAVMVPKPIPRPIPDDPGLGLVVGTAAWGISLL